MILNGCATESDGPYNSKDIQDHSCYNKFGGRAGYCDALRRPM